MVTGSTPRRVVVLIQENKTTDFFFRSLAPWGADVAQAAAALTQSPDYDQPHDRSAWVHYQMGDYPAVDVQLDNDALLPYYTWLAKTYTFCDHHFALGTNSTPGHMLAVGGQTPTLKNPPFTGTHPSWDLPTIFLHAQRAGLDWAAFPDQDGYPTHLYTELGTGDAARHLHPSADFLTMARAGTLPRLCYVWSPSGYDEHPPATTNPGYLAAGQDLTWQRVDAVVQAGQWANTVFLLTWDDWGGYTDHARTPRIETVPDALHPDGYQLIGGSRIPLLIFGGTVRQGIDPEWHSHASPLKTIIDLLALPAFGVPRVDTAPSLADRIDPTLTRPAPPAHRATISQPQRPTPTPPPRPPAPWPGPTEQPLPDLLANGGTTIPAPHDAVVHKNPPKQPTPAG